MKFPKATLRVGKESIVVLLVVLSFVLAAVLVVRPIGAQALTEAEASLAKETLRYEAAQKRLAEVEAGGSSEAHDIQAGLKVVNELLPRDAAGFEVSLTNLFASAGVQLVSLAKGEDTADANAGASFTTYTLSVTGSVDSCLSLIQMLENWPQAVTLSDVKLNSGEAAAATLDATVKVWWLPTPGSSQPVAPQ